MAEQSKPAAKKKAALSAERRLAGYGGPALLVGADGAGVAANRKGRALQALLDQNAADDLKVLIQRAAASGGIISGSASFAGAKGEALLEITVIPQPDDNTFLVIARDLTMERNLRSALVESRQRYKDLVEVSSDFAWEIGPDKTFVFVSPRGALGYPPEDLLDTRPEKIVIDAKNYTPLPFLSDWPMEDVEMWLTKADGVTACVTVSCLPLVGDKGEWQGARGICRDVTDERRRRQALNQARHREHLLNHIVRAIRDEVEPLNMLTAAAAAAARALGAKGCRIYRKVPTEDFVVAAEYGEGECPEPIKEMPEAGAADTEYNNGARVMEIGGLHIMSTKTHYRQSVNGGICMWKAASDGPWDADSRILIDDVANQLGIAIEQIANHERIVKLSRTDGMTGLLNRRAFFEEELPRHIDRLRRNGRSAGLFYLDLDNFKLVNDAYGHHVGDEVIIALRDLMVEHSRPGDVMARLGGDEFAMWLDGIPESVARGRAAALVKAGGTLCRFSGDDDHPLGLSVGVAIYDPYAGENLEDLLARADAAMYDVKHAGKGGYEIALPSAMLPDPPH
ncbi:MAG TPA: diguanylate cyclase [Alphaproteobacteria bacterium]|nr:diguanylate cyclase [Alphaproteobacteria bacterium]